MSPVRLWSADGPGSPGKRTRPKILTALTAALLATLWAAPARAEVSVIRDNSGNITATLQIFRIEDGSFSDYWTPVRAGVESSLLLNPDGDQYLDGPPSVTMNPVTGLPEAVWSYWDGSHYQIAWSAFDGREWSMAQTSAGPDFVYLTAGDRQNFEPRIWIDAAGNRRVAWWRSAAGSADDVAVSVLPAGETQWWLPERVSPLNVPTRRPDIRTYYEYGTFIVAEEDDGGILSAVVFDCPLADGHTPQRGSDPWGRTVVQTTSATTSLDAAISGLGSGNSELPFITWRSGASLATSVYDAEAYVWASPWLSDYPVWW